MLEYLETYVRLTGRILGISYWTVHMTCFMCKCVIVVDYYVKYLLDQDINETEQVQVTKTIFFCLLSTTAVSLASERIELMYSIFLAEKNLLKQPVCPICHKMKC